MRQIQFLKRRGLYQRDMSRDEASALIGKIKKDERDEICRNPGTAKSLIVPAPAEEALKIGWFLEAEIDGMWTAVSGQTYDERVENFRRLARYCVEQDPSKRLTTEVGEDNGVGES